MRAIVISSYLLGCSTFLLLLIATSSTQTFAADSSSAGSQSTSSKPTSSSSSSSGATSNGQLSQSRQSGLSAAASVIGALGSLVPGLITNVAPLVLLFGLGALMMPSLGMSAMGLFRESRRSSNDQMQPNVAGGFPSAFAQYARPMQSSPQDIYYFTKRSLPSLMSGVNAAGIARGLQDLLERVSHAIENADKRYA